MPVEKVLELPVGDRKAPGIALVTNAACVLTLDNEQLKALPSERIDPGNTGIHVLLPVRGAHDGIKLQLNAKLPAPLRDAFELANDSTVPAADYRVPFRHETVA